MSEPKFKLNTKDAARWHALLVRLCLELPEKVGGKVKRRRKYPPLTPAENAEFEVLCAKRSAKIAAHPAVKAQIKSSRRMMRYTDRLMKKIESEIQRLTPLRLHATVGR